MKVLYPDVVYGAIASSGTLRRVLTPNTYSADISPIALRTLTTPRTGVTHAAITNWEYMDVIRQFATVECSDNLVQTVSTVDKYLGAFSSLLGSSHFSFHHSPSSVPLSASTDVDVMWGMMGG